MDRYCKKCNIGSRLESMSVPAMKPPYDNPLGWWKVTTEGDCEGRTTKQLGIHYGYIDEIARHIAATAGSGYSLIFEPTADPTKRPEKPVKPVKKVNISFGIESGTWDHERRAEMIAPLYWRAMRLAREAQTTVTK